MLFFSKSKSKSKSNSNSNIDQKGMTLIEVMVALSIFALVVAGALSLFASAQSTQQAINIKSDVAALRSATRTLYYGQGGYGTSSLISVLNTAKKIPSDIFFKSTDNTLTNGVNTGNVLVDGYTGTFYITVTRIPDEVCVAVLSAASGWQSITYGASNAAISAVATTGAISVQPATLALAQSTYCVGGANFNTLRFESN